MLKTLNKSANKTYTQIQTEILTVLNTVHANNKNISYGIEHTKFNVEHNV